MGYKRNKYIAIAKYSIPSHSFDDCRDYRSIIEIWPIEKDPNNDKPLCSFRDQYKDLMSDLFGGFRERGPMGYDYSEIEKHAWNHPFAHSKHGKSVYDQYKFNKNLALYSDDMDNLYDDEFEREYIPNINYGTECDPLLNIVSVMMVCIIFLVVCIGSNIMVGIVGYLLGKREKRSR